MVQPSCTHRWVFPVSPGLAGTQTPHVWPQSICRMSPSLGLSDVFLMLSPGVWIWGKKEGVQDILLTHWPLHCEVTVFPLPYSILWKALLSPAHLQVREKRTDVHSLCVDIHLLQNICRKDSSFPQ